MGLKDYFGAPTVQDSAMDGIMRVLTGDGVVILTNHQFDDVWEGYLKVNLLAFFSVMHYSQVNELAIRCGVDSVGFNTQIGKIKNGEFKFSPLTQTGLIFAAQKHLGFDAEVIAEHVDRVAGVTLDYVINIAMLLVFMKKMSEWIEKRKIKE